VFDRAEKLHPGAKAKLEAKALKLVGGPDSPRPLPGHGAVASLFVGNQADAILIYCSSAAAAMKELPDMATTPVPPALEVNPVYGFAILSKRPDVEQLALFILSEQGQKILAQSGLYPLANKP
jgi:ABC-type molybdate transport system substrate-binding protein